MAPVNGASTSVKQVEFNCCLVLCLFGQWRFILSNNI